MSQTMVAIPKAGDVTQAKRAAASGFWGAIAEYYDFGLYGTTSAVIFPVVFFGGKENMQLAAVASLASFGVAYLAVRWVP